MPDGSIEVWSLHSNAAVLFLLRSVFLSVDNIGSFSFRLELLGLGFSHLDFVKAFYISGEG